MISGGIVGAANAASSERTSWSWYDSTSSDQHERKPAGKSSRATKGCTCAIVWHARSAGEGDSLSSAPLRCRIHSLQSSLVLRWPLSQACLSAFWLTCSRMPGSGIESLSLMESRRLRKELAGGAPAGSTPEEFFRRLIFRIVDSSPRWDTRFFARSSSVIGTNVM